MQVRVLGPVDAVDDGGNNLALRGPMPARVLAILVANAPAEVSVDDLVAEVWSDGGLPTDPLATLRTLVARVRSTLGSDSIVTGTGSYRLGDIQSDQCRFEELIERARRLSGSPAVADMWRQAIDMWRGPAFGDHAHLDSISPEVARLEELRAEATEAWFDARLAAGEGRELVADVDAAAARFPLREGFRAQQMTVLARAGRQADALRAFQDYRGDLTEVGLQPSKRLAELDHTIAAGELPSTGARRTLRGYELGERLGEGAFAVVHLATQASVGRDVAIKQIRGQLADDPEFIRQFEAEAHLIARLEHPHIVPLYDFWREPGSAYLVMRHLDGGSLAGRLRKFPLELAEAASIVSQVGAALQAAHEANVVHRDVKPANILLDEAGNAYLSDFGIAVEEQERLDPETWLSHGSPAYASPEQLTRRAVGPTADVYALGVTVFEALAGQLPYPAEKTMAGLLERQMNDPIPLLRSVRPDMPAAIDTVLQKATAKTAEARYETARHFVDDFVAASGLSGDQELVTPSGRNPYKGLRAFDEADAADFVGRERLVTKLLASVSEHPVTAVVGPSGSGKSSVVRAGLLPALQQNRLPGSADWFVTTMVPGVDPFADLAAALLRVAVDPPADLAAELARNQNGLARAIRRHIPDDRLLLLLVDQFEELFTLNSDARAADFLDALVDATTDEGARLRVVLTIRADFYDHPLRHPGLAQLIEDATVTVHPLAADELERVITQPAAGVGASFEPGLVAAIAADVADQPGSLPLLQYALTELYDLREHEMLAREAYVQLGGVAGAIGRRAEDVFESLDHGAQEVAPLVMTRLVSLGDGTEDTRRRVLRSELGAEPGVELFARAMGKARLLAFDRDHATRTPTVEVAHEALIREWPRLQRWLDDDRDGLRIHRHLTETAASWDQGGRQDGELYRGGRLESATEWAKTARAAMNETELAFLNASETLAWTEREAEARTNRRLRRQLVGVAVVAALAMIAGVVAFQQRGQATRSAELATENATRAEEQTQLAKEQTGLALTNADLATENEATAETRRLIATAANLAEENYDIALLLAAEAYARNPVPSGLAGLQRVLTQPGNYLGRLGAGNPYHGVAWTEAALVGYTETELHFFDVDSGQISLAVPLPAPPIARNHSGRPQQSLSGTELAIVLHGGLALLVDLESGSTATYQHETDITAVALDSTRGLLAVGDVDKNISLVDIGPGWQIQWRSSGAFPEESFEDVDYTVDVAGSRYWPLFQSESFVPVFTSIMGLTFGPDGSVLASSGGMLRQLSATSGDTTASVSPYGFFQGEPVPQPPEWIEVVGETIVAGGTTSVTLFSESIEQVENRLFERGRLDTNVFVVQSAFSADLSPVSVLNNGKLSLGYETDDRSGELLIDTEASNPTFMDLSPSGRAVAISTTNGVVLTSLSGDQLLARAVDTDGHFEVVVSPDGAGMAASTLGSGRIPSFLDLTTVPARPRRVQSDHPMETAYFLSGSPYLLAGVFPHGEIALLDRDDLTEVMTLPPADFGEAGTADGRLVVLGRGTDIVDRVELLFYDVAARQLGGTIDLSPHVDPEVDQRLRMSTFSPDESRLVTTTISGRAIIIDPHARTVLDVRLPDETGGDSITAIAFSPNGDIAATRSLTGQIHIRDAETLNILWTLEGGTSASENLTPGPFFSPDGRHLLTTRGELPRLWDLATRTDLGTFPSTTLPVGTAGDEQLFLVTGVDGNAMIWNLDTDTWFDIACKAAGRNLTRAEWDQFGPADGAYRATCPQWPVDG